MNPNVSDRLLVDLTGDVKQPSETNVKEPLKCFYWKFGCRTVLRDEDELRKHFKDNLQRHLMQLNEQRVETIVNHLYKRIVDLELANRELKSNFALYENRIDVYEHDLKSKYSNGHYVWKINEFRSKLKQLSTNFKFSCYSRSFYAAPASFKFCCRICVAKKESKNYLGIFVHLKQSEHDSDLQWPFVGIVTIELVHPMYVFSGLVLGTHEHSTESISETMIANKNIESLQKPKFDLNLKGFGYREFIACSRLISDNFIQNDCLTFAIKIRQSKVVT